MSEAPLESPEAALAARRALRLRLLSDREAYLASAEAGAAAEDLTAALCDAVAQLEPECLGLYWPFPSEFNAAGALGADPRFDEPAFALPFARRAPRAMEFRRWDRSAPTMTDGCGIGSCDGAVVVPDVVVVPCVGFTAAGHRLGYGGGYYDRWLAAHRAVTAVGVAWSHAELDLATFAAQPHDMLLTLVVTERGVR